MEKIMSLDPLLGTPNYFDGTDRSLLEQEEFSSKMSLEDYEAAKEIYGNLFSKHPFSATMKILQRLDIVE